MILYSPWEVHTHPGDLSPNGPIICPASLLGQLGATRTRGIARCLGTSQSPRLVAPVFIALLYPPVSFDKAETATFGCTAVNSATQLCAGHIGGVSCILLNEGKHPGSYSFKTYTARVPGWLSR